jgi:signal transduction histidine kinase
MEEPPSQAVAGSRRASGWQLAGLTAAIVGSFVISTVYSQHMAARLDDDAASIAGNASPSIEALSAARGAVLRAEVAVARAVESAPSARADERAAAEAALARARAQEAAYLSMPFYPGERDHWSEVEAATRAFEAEVASCLGAVAAGRVADARAILTTRLRPATERLGQGLEYLVHFNADQQHRMGVEIPRLRRRAAHIAYALDAISAVLAVLMIGLLIRESRRRQLLLANFGRRLEAIVSSTVRITGALGRDGEQRPVLGTIVQEASRLVDADYAAIGFSAGSDRPFDEFVFHGFSPAEVAAAHRPPRPVGVLGSVIADGHGLRLADVTTHPSYRGVPPGHPAIGPFLGAPIRREGRGAGNLYLGRRPGRPPFSEEDEHVIELLATQAAVSAENARLYRELGQQRRRAQLLADASARMVGSLDWETTLEQAANAGLPAFADLCVVHVADEGGAIVQRVMAAADPAWRLMLRDIGARFERPSERHPAMRTLREGRSLRFAVDDETIPQIALDEEHRRVLRQMPLQHGVSVPMVGRARLLGAMTFFRLNADGFDVPDVAFAEELARRAALSIDNALLHESSCLAVRARDDLLAIVSHDLRSPLSAIKLSAGLLKRAGAANDEKRTELANRIERTSETMKRLIEDLLAASKIESGTFSVETRPEPIEPLLIETFDLFREAAATQAIAFEMDIDPEVADVTCDRDRVLEVLSNLVSNALKFTPAAGSIIVTARRMGENVCIRVADSGPGIAESEWPHLFDRYWQARHTRRGGAGLGLFIVKGIVEAHGGHVWAERAASGGACLCFTLPSVPQPLTHAAQ